MVRLLLVFYLCEPPQRWSFNPTMVRLLRNMQTCNLQSTPCFNPTMVRLLRGMKLCDGNEGKFQSHNGAIAAHCFSHSCFCWLGVSIPQWCDCCKHSVETEMRNISGFNPTMVRLLLKKAIMELQNKAVSIPQWCDCCSH